MLWLPRFLQGARGDGTREMSVWLAFPQLQGVSDLAGGTSRLCWCWCCCSSVPSPALSTLLKTRVTAFAWDRDRQVAAEFGLSGPSALTDEPDR